MRKFAFILLGLVVSCNEPKDKRFELLASFLHEDLGLRHIDLEKNQKIILVPEFGCKGCIAQVARNVAEFCKQEKIPENTWVIFSPAKYKATFKTCYGQAVYDSMDYIGGLRVKTMNVTGYEIGQGKVIREVFFDEKQPEQVPDFLFK